VTLNRRLPRTLAAMASFTIVSSLLTALVVAFVISTLTTSATLNRVLPQFLTDNSVEDAEFTTVVPIDETAAAGLEDEFAAVVSRQRSLDVDVRRGRAGPVSQNSGPPRLDGWVTAECRGS